MSNDIVVLLKEQAKEASNIGCMAWPETMLKAAKEIERLREELDAANAALKYVNELHNLGLQ